MEDIKAIFASSLIELRTNAGMTQAQLAEKINYSDKSVSKWERAEALPDVPCLKNIADVLGVDTDYMLTEHNKWRRVSGDGKERTYNTHMVTSVALIGVWTAAIFIFVLLGMLTQQNYWLIFVATVPVSLTVLLVLNSVWNNGRYNSVIVDAILAGLFGVVYYLLRDIQPWRLVFVLLPALAIVECSFRIKKKNKDR